MKKRHFLLGTVAAAGALVVGWGLMPPRSRLGRPEPAPASGGAPAFNGWVRIGSDDRVTVRMPRSEMGQGTHTGLAMLLAEELDADWSRIAIEPAPIDDIYNNVATVVDGLPFHPDDKGRLRRVATWLTSKSMREMGSMVTGGSSSIKDLWLPMREAGAAARAMLVDAAAQRWNVAPGEIGVAQGVVRHAASGRQARFGELAAAAAERPLPAEVVLKPVGQYTIIGKPLPRLPAEATAKQRGSAGFGLDVVRDGMLYASVRMCPTFGGGVQRLDDAKAKAMPGVRLVLKVPGFAGGTGGVAVVADTPWHAMQAVKAVEVAWDEAVPAATFDAATAFDRWSQQLGTDQGFGFFSHGDVDAAMAGAARVIEAEYRAPFVAHHTLEPQNCTVHAETGKATVWAPTQVPGLARWHAAQVLGLPNAAVTVNVTLLGGGFGRRLEVDYVAQAAYVAKQFPGTPVQTFWTREEDTRHDFYRPAAVARCKAGFDAQGRVVAWQQVSAGPSIVHQVMRRVFGMPEFASTAMPDKTTAEGAFDQPYAWPAARIGHVTVKTPIPVGFWRSVGHSHQAFFKECFIDEMAEAAGQDPVAFRAGLLQQQPRALAVLQRAAALAGWGSAPAPAPDGAPVARGVALHASFGSTVAQVVEASLAPAAAGASPGSGPRAIRVHRVICAIDCGVAINPGLVVRQMESGIVFGLSAALHGGVGIERGRVAQSNFHDQPLLRMPDCPAIVVDVLPSSEHPEGVGEPGTPPVAPALANALFVLTGRRQRSLPLHVS